MDVLQALSALTAAGAFVAAGLLVRNVLRQNQRGPDAAEDRSGSAHNAEHPGLSVPRLQARPQGQLPILPAEALFEVCGVRGLIEVIRNRLALSKDNWERDALPVLQRYAVFVQQLPASESHHHAQPGGLLIHTLEVTSYALTIRQGSKLPAGASPEEQVQKQALWSYAVMLAALLHDIGKPVSDVVVHLYGAEPHVQLGQWQAIAGAMDALPSATHYEIDFPHTVARDYSAHGRLSAVLLHALVPPSTMRWLSSDAKLLPALIGFLDGADTDQSDQLRQIVRKADAISVADNLRHGPRTRFSKARAVPMIERLMWALRTLIAEGQLSLNKPGATLFVDQDGEHIWAVSATLAEKVRKFLDEREQRHAGAAGIPSDNTRLFDTWQEYGALVSPPKEHGKGSVWWVRFEVEGWSQVLTVLKFRCSDLFAPESIIPGSAGVVTTPVSPTKDRSIQEHVDGTDGEPSVTPQPTGTAETNAVAASAGAHQAADAMNTVPVQAVPGLTAGPLPESQPLDDDPVIDALLRSYDRPADPPEPTAPTAAPTVSTPTAGAEPASDPRAVRAGRHGSTVPSEFLEDSDCAAAMVQRPALEHRPPVQALAIPKTPPRPRFKAPGAKVRPDAEAFFKWVQQGLGTGDLTYNETDSMVHFVDLGMALVSPKIFKIYLQTNPYTAPRQDGQTELNALQNDLQRGGYILRTVNKTSFHHFRVKQADGTVGDGRLTMYIVPNPHAYIRPVPAANPLLVHEKPEEPGTASSSSDSPAAKESAP